MPYEKISDLPDNVKSTLSEKQQRQWMEVFNSVYGQAQKEKEKDPDIHAAKAAWSVVKKSQEGLENFVESVRLSLLEGTVELFEGHKVRGYAIHPMATHHPLEWPTVRRYLEPYLERAAPTAAGKPFLIDHTRTLTPENHLTLGRWDGEKSAVYYEGEVSDDVAAKIEAKQIKGVSVGLDFQKPGSGILVTEREVIPYAYGFDEFSFLEHMSPGDPQATVQLWEGILREASEQDFILYPIQSLDVFLLDHMQVMWLNQERGIQAIYGRLREQPESLQPFAYLFMKARDWTPQSIEAWLLDNPQYAKSAQAPAPIGIEQMVS